ncbi:hypothetical protein [Actinomyces weissii]|uniref:Uncharacterized protein n=1 Tax=Actinomyces weissii TaxID=675090 RepID=A0A7T7S2B8_9ACTO|nr:hypothetical protein [Actinomyces weissii]QQM67437.1 hypothetical protein JG540_00530 [Actinomyces weissii]
MSPDPAPDDDATCSDDAVAPKDQQPSEPPAEDAASAVAADSPAKASDHTDAVASTTETEAKAKVAKAHRDYFDNPEPTRASSILAAFEWGAGLTLVVSVCAILWWQITLTEPPSPPVPPHFLLYPLGIFFVWLTDLAGSQHKLVLTLQLLLIGGIGAALMLPLCIWHVLYVITLDTCDWKPTLVMTAGLSLITIAAADLLRRWLVCHPGKKPRPTVSKPWRYAVAAVPALLVLGMHAAPLYWPRFEVSQTVAAPAQLPALASSAQGEVAWTFTADKVLGVVAGAAGPVLLQKDGVYGVNPEDGSITWRYRRAPASILSLGNAATGYSTALTSPDLRYMAVRFQSFHYRGIPDTTWLVVIDTTTGKVTVNRRSDPWGSLQITDSVIADGAQVLRLEDGRPLWRLPDSAREVFEVRYENWEVYYRGFVGTGGHSVLLATNGNGLDSLDVLAQEDGTKLGTLTGLVTDPLTRFPLVQGGWAAQWDDPQAAQAALSDGGDPDRLVEGAPAHAVNVDALAQGGASPVPLGTVSGVNTMMSTASGDLCLMGKRPAHMDIDGSKTPKEGQITPVATVLSTASGQAHPAIQDAGVGASTLQIDAGKDSQASEGQLRLLAGDGVTEATGTVTRQTALYLFSRELRPYFYENPDLTLVSTPGAIVVTNEAGHTWPVKRDKSTTVTRLYGIRSQR